MCDAKSGKIYESENEVRVLMVKLSRKLASDRNEAIIISLNARPGTAQEVKSEIDGQL